MRRRTPILAIVLAPIVLLVFFMLWRSVVLPLYRSLWLTSTALEMRFSSENPETRVAALNSVGVRPADEPLVALVTDALLTDPDRSVRAAALQALGRIGSRQPLPIDAREALVDLLLEPGDDGMLPATIEAVAYSSGHNEFPPSVVVRITGVLDESHSDWERSQAARGLAQMASHQDLPRATLERLAERVEHDPSSHVCTQAIQVLARSAGEDSAVVALLTAALEDPRPEVRSAAAVGLRQIAHDREFAGREPLVLAMDTAQPVEPRLQALRILRSTGIEPAAFEDLAALFQDRDPRVAIAALGIAHFMARSQEDDFDRRVLIPELARAMSHPDPDIREAAFAAASRIVGQRPDYRHRPNPVNTAIELGVDDPDPRVRVAALAAMMRTDLDRTERAATLERGLTDADPYVRRQVVSWLGAPRGRYPDREIWLRRLTEDPDPEVASTAQWAQQEWRDRQRAWPVELWREVRAGEYERVFRSVVIGITVAASVLVCGIFLVYFMARLLTYMGRRSRLALAALPVIAVWIAASYGMFFLYFIAAHAQLNDRGELLLTASILWGATGIYAGLGWAMHYAIRR